MNVDTKLYSKALALRLLKILPSIIHPNQVANVKDRFIGEGIRLIDSIIEYANVNNVPAFLLAIDFENAFDSIDWKFLWQTLKVFNFPDEFI